MEPPGYFDPNHPYAFRPPGYEALSKNPPSYSEIFGCSSTGSENPGFTEGDLESGGIRATDRSQYGDGQTTDSVLPVSMETDDCLSGEQHPQQVSISRGQAQFEAGNEEVSDQNSEHSQLSGEREDLPGDQRRSPAVLGCDYSRNQNTTNAMVNPPPAPLEQQRDGQYQQQQQQQQEHGQQPHTRCNESNRYFQPSLTPPEVDSPSSERSFRLGGPVGPQVPSPAVPSPAVPSPAVCLPTPVVPSLAVPSPAVGLPGPAVPSPAVPSPAVPSPAVGLPTPVVPSLAVPSPAVGLPTPVVPSLAVPSPAVGLPGPAVPNPAVPSPAVGLPTPVVPSLAVPSPAVGLPGPAVPSPAVPRRVVVLEVDAASQAVVRMWRPIHSLTNISKLSLLGANWEGLVKNHNHFETCTPTMQVARSNETVASLILYVVCPKTIIKVTRITGTDYVFRQSVWERMRKHGYLTGFRQLYGMRTVSMVYTLSLHLDWYDWQEFEAWWNCQLSTD